MNGISFCLDEIALEGLDGITLPTLWKRLNDATPRLWSTLDDSYKAFLWKSIISSPNVQTFMLEEPREELEDFTDDLKSYPYCCINDQKSGVRGSCSTFYSRELVDLSKESLDHVEELYGNRVVLVASQVLRERVLFGPDVDPFIDISDIGYCLLEWVGRGRKYGRLQSSIVPYTGTEYNTNFHYIKVLQELHMVTKQTVMDGANNRTCIVYLPKFHIEHSRDSLAYRVCSLVGNRPMECISVEYLCCHFDEPQETVKKLMQELCESGHVRYLDASLCHNGPPEDGESSFVDGHEDDISKCQSENGFQLVRPFYNMCNDDGEDDDEEDEEETSPASNQEMPLKVHAEIPLINVIYQLMESKGINGITATECIQHSGLPYFEVRCALLQLESQKEATVVFEDIGRQRMNQYVASKILKQHHNMCEEAPQKAAQPMEPEVCQNEPLATEDNTELSRKSINILESTRNNSSGITMKFQRRRNIVLDCLSKLKVVEGHITLRRLIFEKESESGMGCRIDKKTICRFLDKLKGAGAIQIFNIDVEVKGENRKLVLICDSKMKEDSPEVLAKISQIKDAMETKKVKETEGRQVVNKLRPLNLMGYNTKRGFLPKMPRCEMLHIFLFYLIYELAKPDVNLEAWRQKFGWAKHLTPAHTPKNIGEGWFTAASILMLLPLSLYVKMVGVSFQVDVLDRCINNPATKHMLIKDLPALARHYLTINNRHFTSILDNLHLMAAMKLVTPTTKLPFQFAKDIACHLNRTALLKDTRESLPGYDEVTHPKGKQFPETVFSFSSLADVEQYWSMTRDICLTTHLNAKTVNSDPAKQRKRPNLREYLTDEENVHTSIKPPGDALGAAGFDSGLFCHLRQNWILNFGEDRPLPFFLEDATDDGSVASDWQLCFTTTTVPAERVLKNSGGRGVKRKLGQPVNEKAQKKRKLPKKAVKKREISRQSSSRSDVMLKASTIQKDQQISDQSGSCSEVTRNASTSQRDQQTSHQNSSHSKVRRKTSSVQKDWLSKKVKASKKRAIVNARKSKVNAKKTTGRSHWSVKIHDQRDLEASRRKEVERVTFTPQEQKLLFICTLALRILGKKSTDTGYTDWLWTRDILYKDDYESAKTKTALSISRKYRNIMKDPQTKVNLNICTADCVQEKQFEPYCNLGKGCDEAAFNELVEMLKKKYSMESMETRTLCLPRNLRAIKKQANLQSGLQPRIPDKADKDIKSLKMPVTSLSDIRQGVIRDSIISAVLLEDEKYDPNVAYAFLDQFTEDELTLAISELKKKHIVVRKSLRYGQGRSQALTAFSQRLSTHAHRVLEAHFPSCVISEAISFYHQIQQGGPHSRKYWPTGAVGKSVKPESLTLSADSTLGGHVACILALLATGELSVEMEIPENILRVAFGDKNEELEKELPTNHGGKKNHNTLVSQTPQQTTGAKTTQREKEACLIIGQPVINLIKANNCSTKVQSDESPKELENVQMVLQDGFGEAEEGMEEHISGQLREKTRSLPVSSSKVPEWSVQKRVADPRMMQQQERSRAAGRTDVNWIVGEDGANRDIRCMRTTGNKEQVHRKPIVKKNIGESCIGSGSGTYHRRIQRPFLDVLSGIEDHLFGTCGQSANLPMYKVDLQSKSSFICHLTTTHVGSIGEMDHGNHLSNIQRNVDPPRNRTCDHYNEKKVPARIDGNLVKPTIMTNPCTVKLSLLPSREQEASQRKRNDARELVAQHFETNTHAMPENLDECVSVCSKQFGYTGEDCQALSAIYESIESSKEIGLTCSKVDELVKQRGLPSKFCTEGLIDVLKAFNLVWEVGFVEARFVTSTFKKHWCLPFPHGKVDQIDPGTNNDGTIHVVNTKQVASCGIQTDSTPSLDHLHPIPLDSTITEKADDKSTSSKSKSLALVCIESHRDKPEDDKGEEMIVQQDGNLVGDSVRVNGCGLEAVPKTSNAEEQRLSETTEVHRSSPISRPWFCMNGQKNKKAYNTVHESVLRYIMRYPGVKEFTIAKHFINMIPPVALHGILQTLEEGDCIKKSVFNQKKATLFSSSMLGNEESGKESKVTYFLPTVDAVMKLVNLVLI